MLVQPHLVRSTTRRVTRLIRYPSLVAVLTLAACSGGGDGPVAPNPVPPPPSSTLSLAATPVAVRVQAGQAGNATVRLTRSGPSAVVTLGAAVTGAPAGVTATFAPATIPADGAESAVTFSTTSATPAGEYTITISGSGSGIASTTVTLRVDPVTVSSYTLAVTPATIAVTAGAAAANGTVTVSRTNFIDAVTLAASGAPAGLTVTPPAAPVTGESATLVVQAAASVAAGDYPITLTGTAAGKEPVTTTVLARVAAAAAPSPSPVPPPPSDVLAGFVVGTVVDAAGRPLAGVEVYADNTLYYNTNAIGITNALGKYLINVSRPIGTWRMSARLRREFNGRTYQFDLHPDNAAPFAGVDGAVRNFEWRLSGPTPEGTWYGAATWIYLNWAAGESVRPQDVEVTFTPVGPLADGSAGQVIVKRLEGNYVRNLPLGRYRVSARWVPQDGRTPRPMGMRVRDTGSYTESTILDWPANSDGRVLEAELEAYLPARGG